MSLAILVLAFASCGPGEAFIDSTSATDDATEQEITSGVGGVVRRGEEKQFGPFESTSGAISVAMTGTGDADLRVWMGRKVCEPGLAGTAETCHLTGPGDFYVSVTGIDSSSSFTLNIKYTRAHRDGGSADGGSRDGGHSDGGSADGGSRDGGHSDGGSADGGSRDGGHSDGGSADGGSRDGGAYDGGEYDGGEYDGGEYDGGAYDGGDSDGGPASDAGQACAGAFQCNVSGTTCCAPSSFDCATFCR